MFILTHAQCPGPELATGGGRMQHPAASNVSCDSEVFSSRWREASIGRAATVSRQVPLWVPVIPGEEGGKEGRSGGGEWVSAARLLDAVFRPPSPLPACSCASFSACTVRVRSTFVAWSESETSAGFFFFRGGGGPQQRRPLHLLV